MGRRYHSTKMHKMSEVWGKHGQHKHMQEVARITNSLRRKRHRARMYRTVAELMREERRDP